MKTVFNVLSIGALIFLMGVPVLFLADRISLMLVHRLLLTATILWFTIALLKNVKDKNASS